MPHGVGAIDAFQAVLPEWAVPVVVAITTLGDVWFLFLLLPPLYWFGPDRGWLADREDAGALVGVVLAAFALVVGLKTLFAVPRPPESLHLVHADSYGFPSGHALGSTAVYGGIGLLLDRWTRVRRLAVAAVFVLAIGLSRVFLGVHHLVDVVAGFAVGLALLGSVVVARRRGHTRAAPVVWFAVAAGVLAVGVALVRTGGLGSDPAQALGGTLGAAVAWRWVDGRATAHRVGLGAAVLVLAVVGSLLAVVQIVEPPPPVVGLLYAAMLGGIVGLPGIGASAESGTDGANTR